MRNKEEWEIKAIKNKILLNRITIIIGFITVFISIFGYFNEKSKL